jgi:hypothetical protein
MAQAALSVGSESAPELDWVSAHEALSRLAKTRAALDWEEGQCLLAALRTGAHRHLGFGGFFEYVDVSFGYKPHSVEEKLRVAEALEGCRPSELPECAPYLRRLPAGVPRGERGAGRNACNGACRAQGNRAEGTADIGRISEPRLASQHCPAEWRNSEPLNGRLGGSFEAGARQRSDDCLPIVCCHNMRPAAAASRSSARTAAMA